MTNPREILRAKLNLETARVAWPELERHFARGVVIKVSASVDLVDAALQFAENDTAAVQALLADARLARADLADAEDWHARQPVFWAVVVAPWVLIQESTSGTDS
ncbi:MAG TPA: DUF2288 domain-containing protein [Thiobacillaceae bacterium]|nr:DUF2288 domain-containing protein [Thiobacillaceae bacterium]